MQETQVAPSGGGGGGGGNAQTALVDAGSGNASGRHSDVVGAVHANNDKNGSPEPDGVANFVGKDVVTESNEAIF